MDKKTDTGSVRNLFQTLISLQTIEECESFLNDLCTIQELESLSQRLDVANMLYKGKTYAQICETTGASTATISRVNRALTHGSGGYKTVIERMQETQ